MPMTTFSVRMDEDLKKELDELCAILRDLKDLNDLKDLSDASGV